jgi:hypothetical protein
MRFIVSYIFREGNRCANKIDSLELQSNGFVWGISIPSSFSDLFCRNRSGLLDLLRFFVNFFVCSPLFFHSLWLSHRVLPKRFLTGQMLFIPLTIYWILA